MRFDDGLGLTQSDIRQADVPGQMNCGREPELRFAFRMRDMHVDTRFLAGEEEQAELPVADDGRGHGGTVPQRVFCAARNWYDNPWFPVELDKERRDWLRRDPEGYRTVWEGQCRPAVEGAIYAREIAQMQADGRLGQAPYDPLLKVHTVWDLGWNDAMAILLVQRSGSGEIRLIDFIEDSHRTLDSYVAQLTDMKLNWGRDFIPHDGQARDFKSGRSSEEILQALCRNVEVLGRDDVEEGIHTARMMFPRCYADRRAMALINRLSATGGRRTWRASRRCRCTTRTATARTASATRRWRSRR